MRLKGRQNGRATRGGEEAETRGSDKDLHRREGRGRVANGVEVSERVCRSGRAEYNAGGQRRDGEDGHRHAPGKDTSDLERDRYYSYDSEDRVSGRRFFSERDEEPEWHRRRSDPDWYYRESESYYRRGGHDLDDNGGMGIEGVSARDEFPETFQGYENMNHSCSGTPVRGRHHNRDKDNSMDRHYGWGSREGSVDRASDRNGYRNGRTGVKVEYWLHGACDGGFDNRAETSDFRFGDQVWGKLAWRNSCAGLQAHPGQSQYRPGTYLTICNARFNQLRGRSPPAGFSPRSRHAAVPLDPSVSPPRYVEEGYDASQSHGKGWTHHDSQRPVQGSHPNRSVEEGLDDCPQLKSDRVVHREGSHDRVTLEHARSLPDSTFSSMLQRIQQSVMRSPGPPEVSPQFAAPSGNELLPQEQTCKIANAENDLCSSGTEAHGAGSADEDVEDFHIDERVERLMEGRTLIPGKEKEIVHEALSIASQRVQQEYESDIAIEESPRSHGGFADIGDQWKDGDFGSDVQGLEGFGFDQQVTKVDTKAEDAVVGAGSEGGTEVASAPEPTPRVSGAEPHHSESKSHHRSGRQESWKWPSRGGDWKLVYLQDSSHHAKGEGHTQGTAEKGYSGYPRKMVMNGGHALCETERNRNLRDPRRHFQGSAKASLPGPMKLQLPSFAQRPGLLKVATLGEDHNVIQAQHTATILKGAMTPKSQGSTPRAHVSVPVKDRSFSYGLPAGLKMNKSGKDNSTPGPITGTAIKSLGQAKQQLQQKPLSKASKVGTPAIKHELFGTVKNSNVTEKRGTPRSVPSVVDVQLKSSSDHVVDTIDKKRKPSLTDGSLEKTPSRTPQAQASDLELGKGGSATPLKKLFLSRSFPKEELDLERDDFVSKSEGKELSIVTSLGVPVSPALSVLTPAALNCAPSTMSHLSVTVESHSKGFTAEDTPKHEKRLLDVHFTEQASSSVYETLGDNGARMMDVEVEFCDRLTSSRRDVTFLDGSTFLLKRKASSVQDGEAFKKRHRDIPKRRIVGNGDSEVDRKVAHSSPMTNAHSSISPLVEGPVKSLEVDPLEGQDQLEQKAEEPNWAVLQANIIYQVFRSLRGDLKSLVNAMATCKSWMAAGQKYKTMLKLADLSSVHEQCLDAVLESLPGFGAGKLRRIVLKGCNVSPESLGHLLRACPSISQVEIGYDEQFRELSCSFPNVKWLPDQNGGQSPKEGLNRKREVKHLKTKSLQVIGVSHRLRESSSRDGGESEMHPVSDSASKVRSPNGYTCLMRNVAVEETEMNESYQDSGVTHFTNGASDGVDLLKLNNGGTIVKSNGVNGSMKAGKQENGNSMARLPVLKRKAPSGSLRRKHDKASHRMLKPVGAHQRLLADKYSSSTVKVEHHSKSTIVHSSLFEGDRTLEKEMRLMLRVMMEADSDKCFQPASIVPTDGKGVSSLSAKALDLLAIERKLKTGAYAGGKDGFKAFKEDVYLLIRIGFRNSNDKLMFSAAEKIFKLAHQQFAAVENQIAGTLPTDSNNQGKLPGSRPSSKAGKGGLKDSILHHRRRKKRKAWDDDGVPKGGKFGVAKKGRQGESSSGDVDSDSDSTEHETRKVLKLKKTEQSWESEGDSSEDDEEPTFMEDDEEETETEASDSDVPSESEGEDGVFEDENYETDDTQVGFHYWGARMTKAAMVPPVTRKYVVIEEYRIVADKERVEEKMKVELPEDYDEKLQAAKDKLNDSYSHLDIPETRDYQPRKKLGEEVLEQEVYGIDPYTHNLLWDTMPTDGFSDSLKQQFIEERLLLALNREGKQFTGSGKAPMELNLERVVERITLEADVDKDWALHDFSDQLLSNMRSRPKDKFVAYRKGLGVVCNKDNGLEKDEFVVEFFGEVYPPWRWYEKQDGIRSLQKKDKDTTPEFYNIFYERPKGDAAGYDILVVDAMHKANFASRLCHSCRPNCEAKITAVNNTYIIGVYTLKPIKRGEELTFDYNSVTESKEEYNNAVCLCGSQGCRGSYLNLTGSGTFEEVILKHHGLLDRHRLLLDSCSATSVSDEGMQEMRQAGLGTSLLSGLPPWVLKYAASLVHFMNIEKTLLPAELLKDLELKLKQGVMEGATEENAEITTEGVYNQRIQNLAITLDKVRHILTKIYKNPGLAPPPLQKLDKRDMVQWIWKREDSVVSELVQCLAPHLPKETLSDLKQSITKHAPHDLGTNLMQCLLWLRDELRRLPATCKARHDAAADLIHIYAHTRTFFVVEDYSVVESTSMNIHPLDLGSSRHAISGPRVWHKTYGKEYVWGQLIGWYKQSVADPGAGLAKTGRGCLTLPDVSSCYAKSMQHDFRQGYGQRHREKMICHMEEKPQQKWPTSKFWSQFWSFKNERGLFGSPMLDSVLQDKPLDDQMVEWLKSREDVFVGPWDEQ